MKTQTFSRLFRAVALSAALSLSGALVPAARAAEAATAATEPPTAWVDPDTGHRIVRLTREPGSDSFYFNYNGYAPDG